MFHMEKQQVLQIISIIFLLCLIGLFYLNYLEVSEQNELLKTCDIYELCGRMPIVVNCD